MPVGAILPPSGSGTVSGIEARGCDDLPQAELVTLPPVAGRPDEPSNPGPRESGGLRMNRFIVGAAVLLLAGSVAVAQSWAGGSCPGPARGGGQGPGACGGSGACAGCGQGAGVARGRAWDPATVTTTSGQVESVETIGHRGQGIHVQLRTGDRGLVDVRLGPSWFLEQQKLAVQKGDQVEVSGSIVERADGAFMIAQYVKKGEVSVALRDASGVPVWAGWR